MAVMKILVDMADCYREGIVQSCDPMPNVDGRYIIRVKPMGVSGLFSTYEISNIPRSGWKERPRPDGNIAFILLMNESGKAPFLDELEIMVSDAINTNNELNKTLAIREKAANTKQRKYSENILNLVNENREILDAWEKKKNNPNEPRAGFRNPNM